MKMQMKKRTKRSRYRGTHTHKRGAKKKARGKGHRGGVGKSGSGKRADQKKNLKKDKGKGYFGNVIRKGGRRANKIEIVDLGKIKDFAKYGKKSGDSWKLNLEGKKVLCTGELKGKFIINSKSASKGAVEKIKKTGGSIALSDDKDSESKEKE